ncbi:MAG: rRNA maturation RNase YbeY [Actinobacteria bacterium]|nr:rRNA maturation RNase YbeY [Actinomycetota bacterium]
MSIEVLVSNDQKLGKLDLKLWAGLIRKVLEAQGAVAALEVNLAFVSEDDIAGLHLEYLHLEGPTDVLSFPLEDDALALIREEHSGAPMLLGDMVICPAVAERQAGEYAVSLEDEIALLVVHGSLHLLGFDHQIDSEAEEMESLEKALLQSLYKPEWERHR